MEFFLRGIILGFSIALPVGPIGILCIRRTLTQGQLAGLLSGLGAATADAIYGAVAGFGLTFISAIFMSHASGLRVLGGVFLCYLGWKTLRDGSAIAQRSTPANQAASSSAISLWVAYSSTVLLTLTNPITVLSFAAVFAGLGLAESGSLQSASVLVTGVFLGSALWWLLLSSGVSLLRSRFNPQGLQWLNRISGLIILAFGIIALIPRHS